MKVEFNNLNVAQNKIKNINLSSSNNNIILSVYGIISVIINK